MTQFVLIILATGSSTISTSEQPLVATPSHAAAGVVRPIKYGRDVVKIKVRLPNSRSITILMSISHVRRHSERRLRRVRLILLSRTNPLHTYIESISYYLCARVRCFNFKISKRLVFDNFNGQFKIAADEIHDVYSVVNIGFDIKSINYKIQIIIYSFFRLIFCFKNKTI